MYKTPEIQSFKLVIKPGGKRIRGQDYLAILGLCVLGAIALVAVVGAGI